MKVFDGFYENPDSVRERVLKEKFLRYPKSPGSKQKGYNGLYFKPSPRTQRALMDRMARIMGCDLAYQLDAQGHFRLLTARDERLKTTSVHVDHVGWSGVVSLLPPNLPSGGTSFWRHRKSGLIGIHDQAAVARAIAADPGLEIGAEESRKKSAWELTSVLGYEYNRLLLFQGNLFHSSAPGFGTRRENSKLTQVFFFYEKGTEPRKEGVRWAYSLA
jgi:hypothetical protein